VRSKLPFAESTSAAIPAASGVAEDVPAKSFVDSPSAAPFALSPRLKPRPSIETSVVKMSETPPLVLRSSQQGDDLIRSQARPSECA
jgi:hypothetical protein